MATIIGSGNPTEVTGDPSEFRGAAFFIGGSDLAWYYIFRQTWSARETILRKVETGE